MATTIKFEADENGKVFVDDASAVSVLIAAVKAGKVYTPAKTDVDGAIKGVVIIKAGKFFQQVDMDAKAARGAGVSKQVLELIVAAGATGTSIKAIKAATGAKDGTINNAIANLKKANKIKAGKDKGTYKPA